MVLQLTRDRWYAYAGAKTALVLNDLIKEQETLYGFMAGAGWDVFETTRFGRYARRVWDDLLACEEVVDQ